MATISIRREAALTLRNERRDGYVTLRAFGDLDSKSALAFEDSLLHAFEGDASSIVVDLTELAFVDPVGVRVVHWAERQAGGSQGRIRLAGLASVRRSMQE